jgi:asparagine synthase (glutamine-hydrolysing)
MIRRGPDGQGEWFSADARIGLAHRRLSIIDLSDAGAQPMASEDGLLVITFNGEIYNYRRLRARLEAKGYRFRSHSDTEVLLHLYSEHGINMLRELRGMFAFALWDVRAEHLYLARDPYGIKPLYYAHDGGVLRAASQVKALLAGGALGRQLEPAALAGFYLLGSVPEPWTLHQGIMALPPGAYLRVARHGPSQLHFYCDIAAILAEASQRRPEPGEAPLHLLADALTDSVHVHLVSDVPVGLFLSSGVDSGALAALAAGLGQTLEAVTLGFEEYAGTPDDEVPLATEIAAHYGLPHTVERISRANFLALLPRIMTDMDQPTIDGINVWLVSRAAAAHGWKVALSGVGGDELLGGYQSFQSLPRWTSTLAIPSRIPLLGDLFHAALSRLTSHVPALSPKLSGMLRYGASYAGAYLLKRGLFLPEELPAVMGRDMAAEGLRRLDPLSALNRPLQGRTWRGAGFRVSALESSHYMRNQLLRDTDWAGMAHSLEIRTPLIDIDLLSRVAPLLLSLGHQFGKQALAAVPAHPLPPRTRRRSKTGFTVPVARWQEQDARLDAWRRLPMLRHKGCPWARRWAYTLMHTWENGV